MEIYKITCIFVILFVLPTIDSMTRQQLKNSGKIMKKSCIPKNDVTEELVGDIEKGKFIEDRNVMCYIACIYTMTQVDLVLYIIIIPIRNIYTGLSVIETKKILTDIWNALQHYKKVKNNKLNYEAVIKQIDVMFPAEMRAAVKASVEHCKDISKKYKDICESSYWTAKCMYEFDPQNFVFP